LRRTIEAWRLLKRLVAVSKQQNGREHPSTKELERRLLENKTECVTVLGHGFDLFEA
jgi:hypothetical protein